MFIILTAQNWLKSMPHVMTLPDRAAVTACGIAWMERFAQNLSLYQEYPTGSPRAFASASARTQSSV